MDFSKFFNYPTDNAPKTVEQEPTFLGSFTDENWQEFLSYTQTELFNKDDIAIHFNEIDPSLRIVMVGEFDVLIPTSGSKKMRKIATISQGSIFGELSFIDGKPRSAVVISTCHSEMLKLTRDMFDILAAKNQYLAKIILLDLANILASRLRRTTAMLS